MLIQNFTQKEKEYFPDIKRTQIQNNFNLFDRDNDGFLNWDETKETIISLNYNFQEEQLLNEIYQQLERIENNIDQKGINFKCFLILLSYELRNKDLSQHLIQAFKQLDENSTGFIETEKFKELLMYYGYKYNEQQAEIFLKFADQKNEGKIQYFDLVQKISVIENKKKKKKKKKKQNQINQLSKETKTFKMLY